jgi:hypothetical protein
MNFTKKDLISGEHIVECSNGKRYLVAGDLLIRHKGYMSLWDYTEELQLLDGCSGSYNIVKVYSGRKDEGTYYARLGLEDYITTKELKLVWDRNENTELQKLQQAIKDAQMQIDKLVVQSK